MTRLSLLERLKELQDMPKFQNRDIRTITAMMSMEALAKHVEVCEAAVQASAQDASQNAGTRH
ncbi:hypothetical protein [Nitratireductor sp. ZSWI3]|uniref:hypothetical protein n=1 Tax=Nitratireductor sp. ZSWI3 TaxID=2966359 RepID=UPI00214F6CDA|nr:hypothetical protein [Nitratireductor sp. ZSWI3]MCR4267209.1 hypothetical protein [Nitratireductor sp. ZSWI3]